MEIPQQINIINVMYWYRRQYTRILLVKATHLLLLLLSRNNKPWYTFMKFLGGTGAINKHSMFMNNMHVFFSL